MFNLLKSNHCKDIDSFKMHNNLGFFSYNNNLDEHRDNFKRVKMTLKCDRIRSTGPLNLFSFVTT